MAAQYQRKDHYYRLAKEHGYRSRSAYKLLELDKSYSLLKPGMRVLDLGSYPGGWLQVVQRRIGHSGVVVGVDLRDVEPLPGVILYTGDIADTQVQEKIAGHGKFDLIISDMSPKLSGIRFQDAVRSAELVLQAAELSNKLLKQGGDLVAKLFPGAEVEEVVGELRASFNKVSRKGLKSTRGSSKEFYLVSRGYLAS